MTAPSPGGPRPRLSAADRTRPPAPVRIVHLGLGAFHRAHQAWYTEHAPDADAWGIAAFTGRRPDAAAALAEQDCLYTLVERGPDDDRVELITSVVEAADGEDIARLLELMGSSQVAIVTLTITEAGYRLREDGDPDLADPLLRADVTALTAALQESRPLAGLHPSTALGRLLLALEARRRAGGGPLALVPCDNLPGNGGLLARGTLRMARLVSPELAAWITEHVSFISTSVDRITPRTTDADVAALRSTSRWNDDVPVVTEPFADWILSGRFPAGRPAWDAAGARFVADIEPWERRKLWLLNGAHTLLSFAGPGRGHATVAEAFADPLVRDAVERFWDEAVRHLPEELDLPAYRAALADRFANPRIEHRLEQIAQDGSRKLRLRVVPVAEAEVADGREPPGCAAAIAAWADRSAVPRGERATPRIAELSPLLADRPDFVALVDTFR